jgi:hypothetical protein
MENLEVSSPAKLTKAGVPDSTHFLGVPGYLHADLLRFQQHKLRPPKLNAGIRLVVNLGKMKSIPNENPCLCELSGFGICLIIHIRGGRANRPVKFSAQSNPK